ncbi:hypothetical protein B0T09DRAFT_372604 [Sordaria sp. MPI-SDFR-AT-0083]|nr:hypothetical protein B0T09DRAFT_372604 [Sordaria sp. MPI-SDFR-AT-0083]
MPPTPRYRSGLNTAYHAQIRPPKKTKTPPSNPMTSNYKPPKPPKLKTKKEYTHEKCPGPGIKLSTLFSLRTWYIHQKIRKTGKGYAKKGMPCYKCEHFRRDKEAKKRHPRKECDGTCLWPHCPRYHIGLYREQVIS